MFYFSQGFFYKLSFLESIIQLCYLLTFRPSTLRDRTMHSRQNYAFQTKIMYNFINRDELYSFFFYLEYRVLLSRDTRICFFNWTTSFFSFRPFTNFCKINFYNFPIEFFTKLQIRHYMCICTISKMVVKL